MSTNDTLRGLLADAQHALEFFKGTYPYSPPCHGWEEQVLAHKVAREAITRIDAALAEPDSGEVVPHSAQWPTIPGLSQKPKEVAAWLHEWRAGNAGGIVVSLAQMSLEGLRRSRGEHAKIVSSDPLYKGYELIDRAHDVIAEHSGCGYGCQVDQITVRLYRGDKVLLVRGATGSALNKAPAKAEPECNCPGRGHADHKFHAPNCPARKEASTDE